MATLLEVTKIMTVMKRFYPSYELDDTVIELYASMLTDVPIDALEAAAKTIITKQTFFPSLAEWRQAALDIVTAKAGIPTAFEAWQEVISQARAVGSYGMPVFSHPLIERTVQVFGWRALCMSENSDYDRAHFFKAYAAFADRHNEEARTLPDVKAVSEKYRLGSVSDGVKALAERLNP